MDNIILNNEDNKGNLKLNLDDLFQYKKKCDLNVLNSYNKVLERAHTRIKTTSRQKNNEQCCWFVVPEVMIGVPKYDIDVSNNYLYILDFYSLQIGSAAAISFVICICV